MKEALRPRFTSNEVRFRSSFEGKNAIEKAVRRYAVFKCSNTPTLLEGVD